MPHIDDPAVLVGTRWADDAGVYQLSEDLAIVQTVDFFTPVVDDPYDFGRVAAANALSDIYAMGAEPITALNIVGFPVNDLPLEVLRQILKGGADKAVEAGVAVIGGHSIDDREPKFGLAVTGRAHPDRLMTNDGGRAGDRLVLTKPLGVGILTTAIKQGKLTPPEIREVVELMAALNRDASEVARHAGLRAATDITGFGLLGHLHELAHASGLAAEVDFAAVPFLGDRVPQLVRDRVVPGGSRKNLAFIEPWTDFADSLSPEDRLTLADAQTSGGLLLAVPEEKLAAVLSGLRERNTPAAAVIGTLVSGEAGRLRVHRN